VDAWTFEVKAAATLFTDNDDFNRGQTRAGADLLGFRARHLQLPARPLASLDVNYFTGGRTTIAGNRKQDLQRNWRVGATYAFPVNVQNSIKLYARAASRTAPATVTTCWHRLAVPLARPDALRLAGPTRRQSPSSSPR